MVFPASVFRIFGLCMAMTLTGCSSLITGGAEDPDVRLLKVDVVKARLLHQDLKLRFRVDNPNDSSILVRGLRYKVMLNDILIAEGDYSDWFIVKADSHKNFSVPIRTNLWEHLKDVTRMLGKPRQPVHYRLEGKLKTGFLFGHRVRIGRDGEIIPGDLIPE
ncbi:LEA type 2 family protein [Pseudomonas sp. efr-133-TYG-103a]|jgi:LEA14-like dessication related protein|uniref:LEA type 2 family protein n=1 Tax=Pseudomonas sp. efr-133-TYG-103a TaxID=3040308 RepID=UPI0025528001|nr:LEA type 2 family protein [Pseudomonas sp. efr-133-TYG-103a]